MVKLCSHNQFLVATSDNHILTITIQLYSNEIIAKKQNKKLN